MQMIAIGTVHAKQLIRRPHHDRDGKVLQVRDPKDRGETVDVVVAPGKPFDTTALAISDAEAANMVRLGQARRRTREVAVDGPASFGTGPDPDRVADRSMAGEGGQQQQEDTTDYESMKVDELRELAATRTVDVSGLRTKQEIIDALKAAWKNG